MDIDLSKQPQEEPEEASAWAILLPTKGYVVTPVTIYICIALFALMGIQGVSILEPTGKDLIQWGADYGPFTLAGEYWRALSCVFIHIGTYKQDLEHIK